MVTGTAIDLSDVLETLPRTRLFDLARVFGVRIVSPRETRAVVVERLADRLDRADLCRLLEELGRDELRAVCRVCGLPDKTQRRESLIRELSDAAGLDKALTSHPHPSNSALPSRGQIIAARGRQWMVEAVVPAGGDLDSPLVRLACLDDDAPGRPLELLWDLEIGARVAEPDVEGLGEPTALDPPAWFGAYLHALKWNTVSAADATLFQSPFRAGIKLMAHQLTPLMKALELPRANLFIADDVGLGKTIEAGLVLQELILRQQAEFVLIICPASICLQWRDEMMRRFGLGFEVMNRAYIDRKRVERGFGVNPWATHNRFIVSHPLIRRADYRDPLLAYLGHRAEKGLLILDEAHVAAPASASRYAVDSDTTRALRDLAPKFDNRLFLSATPHNGHSNSFSALLEILDPVRFTRGVPISGPDVLQPVMVRRLKRDLRNLGVESFPERVLVKVALTHADDVWRAEEEHVGTETSGEAPERTAPVDVLTGPALDLEMAELLAEYTALRAPSGGRGQLVFVNLQKRLLSSPAAFARTLDAHVAASERAGGRRAGGAAPPSQRTLAIDAEADSPHGLDDDEAERLDEAAVRADSETLETPDERAQAVLNRLRERAEAARREPDAKAAALLDWLRRRCCAAIGLDADADAGRGWSERRVIVFTEYGDTKRYLQELLSVALAHTDGGDERVLVFHGGMADDRRDEVQRAFNAPPDEHPVRILLATDAAREGVNLQGHCADLFHYDVPWNPSRLEQRNGRIDRTLQPSDRVRCHYFVYTQRPEDRVLDTLLRKVEIVREELGSVGSVLLDDMERAVAGGLRGEAAAKLDAVAPGPRQAVTASELESQRKVLGRLEEDVHRAGRRLERSRRALEVQPDRLRGVVDIGLRLAGTDGLVVRAVGDDKRETFTLPPLDASWEPTLDSLRPPRSREEPFWEWRKRPPHPVTFEPLATLRQDAEQLHLAHPLVKRILARFLAQGYGADDLSRTAGVVVPGENAARVIAYARLSLFGRGAARLHDELLAVAAPWAPGQDAIAPYKDAETTSRARAVTEAALADGGRPLPTAVAERVRPQASALYRTLWPALEELAERADQNARQGLARRASKESEEIRRLLEGQRRAIVKAGANLRQLDLLDAADAAQQRQVELDIQHLVRRDERIDEELESEPKAISALYDVRMRRLIPIGLVIAWPESMT